MAEDAYIWSKAATGSSGAFGSPHVLRSARISELATNFREPESSPPAFTPRAGKTSHPIPLSVTYPEYPTYIKQSKGEFTVAKDQYVRLNTGWFPWRSHGLLSRAGRTSKHHAAGQLPRAFVQREWRGLFAFENLRAGDRGSESH